MGAFLNLEGRDLFAFVVCGAIGFVAAQFLPAGAWAVFGSILISYHLFLGWLLVSAEQETGISLPIFSTILTHLACMVVVVGFGMGRNHIPFFSLLRWGIASLAIFERGWLFSGRGQRTVAVASVADAPAIADNAEDYQAWLHHLAQRKPSANKPGMTLKDEYQAWLAARAKARTTGAATDGPV